MPSSAKRTQGARKSARLLSTTQGAECVTSELSHGQFSSVKATLKEVSIPLCTESLIRPGDSSNTNSYATSLSNGSTSSEFEKVDLNDTPRTSVMPTPATSVKSKIISDFNGTKSISKLKRKRVASSSKASPDRDFPDAAIAESLQTDEYREFFKNNEEDINTSDRDKPSVLDSDSDALSAALSINMSNLDEYVEELEIQQRSGKRQRSRAHPQTTSLSLVKKDRSRACQAASMSLDEESILSEISDGGSYSDDPISEDESFTEETTQANSSFQNRPSGGGRGHSRNGRDLESHIRMKVRNRKARERMKLEKAHPNIKTMWDDLEKIPLIPRERIAQPENITRRLKPFQLEGLNWMIKQEKTQYKGGLLGDEMGMGKTIQAVSLIMSDFPAKTPTLVVVPPVALLQWSKEIEDYTNGKLRVLVFHGAKTKGYAVNDLKKYNVIMISYQSLESLYRKEVKGWNRGQDIVKEDSSVHDIHYHRVILDEAHSIKQRNTGIAKACFALTATHKWCLSGTPVQNRIGEFFSLLRFLEVRPFADYFCKRCACSQIHWSLNKEHRCSSCNHSGAEHVSVFNQELLNPIIQTESNSLRQEALDKLRLITDRIMLRRMKRDYTSSMV